MHIHRLLLLIETTQTLQEANTREESNNGRVIGRKFTQALCLPARCILFMPRTERSMTNVYAHALPERREIGEREVADCKLHKEHASIFTYSERFARQQMPRYIVRQASLPGMMHDLKCSNIVRKQRRSYA